MSGTSRKSPRESPFLLALCVLQPGPGDSRLGGGVAADHHAEVPSFADVIDDD